MKFEDIQRAYLITPDGEIINKKTKKTKNFYFKFRL